MEPVAPRLRPIDARVLLVGDFSPNRYGASLRAAFDRGGATTAIFDASTMESRLAWYLRGRVGYRLFRQNRRARLRGAERVNAELLALAASFRPDVTLIVSTYYLTPETIQRLQAQGSKVGVYFTDNPLPGFASSRPEQLPMLEAQPVVMVWSDQVARALRTRGVRSAHFVGFAWDAASIPAHPAGQNGRVLFAGNWDRERELFLNALAPELPLDIVGGPEWASRTRRSSPVRNAFRHVKPEGGVLAKLLADASVSLNILRRQHHHDGVATGVIMRTYEIPGAGGVQLATHTPEAAAHFAPDVACCYFADTATALAECDRLLTNPARALDIARAGHAAVLARHTYDHRVREMLALCRGDAAAS